MTKEEAIKYLIKPIATSTEIGEEKQKEFEAYNMAIEALSADRPQGVGRYENAMQKLREMPKYLNGVKVRQIKKISIDRPSGEWVNEWKDIDGGRMYGACCSVCHTIGHSGYNYCPSCGARMENTK